MVGSAKPAARNRASTLGREEGVVMRLRWPNQELPNQELLAAERAA
ncbi:MAG: hypothetical protein M3Z25_22795 [Actinomycetota bacterium]|nr:hypothetical protein [Actinomycetota bacterium]